MPLIRLQVRAELVAADIFCGINGLYDLVSRYAVTDFDGCIARFLPINGLQSFDALAEQSSSDILVLSNACELGCLSTDGWRDCLKLNQTTVVPPISTWLPIATVVVDELWLVVPGSGRVKSTGAT